MSSEMNQSTTSAPRPRSRKLSVLDYFRVLQLEALNADLRSRIYTKSKDRSYWKATFEKKKQTALEIAERNKVGNVPLPNIFTDEDMLATMRQEIFGSGGYPKFTYVDHEQEAIQGYLDSMCYYTVDSDVVCDFFGEIIFGKVKSYTPNSKIVSVRRNDNGELIDMPISQTTRIL